MECLPSHSPMLLPFKYSVLVGHPDGEIHSSWFWGLSRKGRSIFWEYSLNLEPKSVVIIQFPGFKRFFLDKILEFTLEMENAILFIRSMSTAKKNYLLPLTHTNIVRFQQTPGAGCNESFTNCSSTKSRT